MVIGNNMNNNMNGNANNNNNNNNNNAPPFDEGGQRAAIWLEIINVTTDIINQLKNDYVANPVAIWKELLVETCQEIDTIEGEYESIRDFFFDRPEMRDALDNVRNDFQHVINDFNGWLNEHGFPSIDSIAEQGLPQNGGKRKSKKTRKSKNKKRRTTAKGKASK
jgi:hypothetical protein